MWISRAHFDLISDRAKDFRAWHEQERDRWAERLADRDATIAEQEKRLSRLEAQHSELLGKLFEREQVRVMQSAASDETVPSGWDAIMREQAQGEPDA